MIVSNGINTYGSTLPMNTYTGSGSSNPEAKEEQAGASQTSTRVLTESDGSTVMQLTTLSPGGTMMRKNITLHEAGAFSADPTDPSPMLRKRSDMYESMMQVF